jgi:DNA-binding MarR family transcriptional regulator
VIDFNLTGQQASVARAVSKGTRLVDDIVTKTGLTKSDVRTALKRLRDKGLIQAVHTTEHGRKAWREYEPVGAQCILADIWQGYTTIAANRLTDDVAKAA